jgi:hypothetical protein
MNLAFSHPAKPASHAAMMVAAKTALKAIGWTVPRSGDTSTYDNTGADLITSGAVLGVNTAWYELLAPDGSWGQTWQRLGAFNSARIKAQWGTDFSGGSPSATQTGQPAAATDEILLLGGGTDAAPTGGTFAAGSDGNQNLHIVADTEPPYGFLIWSHRDTGVDGPDMALLFDPMNPDVVDASDLAPSVAYANGSNTTAFSTGQFASTTLGPRGWISKGSGGAITVIPANYGTDAGSAVFPDALPRASGNVVELFPVWYARRNALAAPRGYKGLSQLLAWVGSNEVTGTRLDVNGGTGNYIVVGQVAIPWDNTALTNDPSAGATATGVFRSQVVYGDPNPGGGNPSPLSPSGNRIKRIPTKYLRPRRYG